MAAVEVTRVLTEFVAADTGQSESVNAVCKLKEHHIFMIVCCSRNL